MADDIGCKEHADSPICSHLLMTVKLFLWWLEKQNQKKFCQNPGKFPVCKTSVLRVAPLKEFSHLDLCMPFAFLDLSNWARSRDFNQEVNQDSIEWYPVYLTDFASYLESGGQSGPFSGSGSGLTAKEGARALKIKQIIYENVIPPTLHGAKRKLDCITSSSRHNLRPPPPENRPVPINFKRMD